MVSDIFGITQAFKKLALDIDNKAVIFDPYEGAVLDFADEKSAYKYFIKNVGLESYSEKLKEYIKAQTEVMILIGFSVGATAIWNISEENDLRSVQNAFCYYGSQIRYNLNIKPKFPINLVFPSREEHFSIKELIDNISDIENTSVRQVPFLHGFMNEKSLNFDLNAYALELKNLINDLDKK
ncbi:dienelactone hydrolase family protein [Halarcobacter ebronensis]|uniref:dienelactone hydrolase family protein n=1 Tax=Halarcobacter ebronensis TaxID=1462615 RepID=UPI001E3EDDA0